MARPPEDPDITDLARYRKAREAEARKVAAAKKASGRQPILGANPRAGLILAIAALALLALTLGTRLL